MVVFKQQNTRMQSKLKNKGMLGIFVGYPNHHPKDAYRILNIATKKILITRDITWLKVTYGDYFKIPIKERSYVKLIENECSDSESESESEKELESEDVNKLREG